MGGRDQSVRMGGINRNHRADWIGIRTPIARALIGATLGSTVEAKLPKGTVSLLIKDIKKPRS